MSPVMQKGQKPDGFWPFISMVVGGDSNPRHADFQSAALPTELPDRIRGNGFRFDASIYFSGYVSRTQELFLSMPGSESMSQGDGSSGSPDLRYEGDEGAEGDERGEGHRAGEEGIAIFFGGNFPNGAA